MRKGVSVINVLNLQPYLRQFTLRYLDKSAVLKPIKGIIVLRQRQFVDCYVVLHADQFRHTSE